MNEAREKIKPIAEEYGKEPVANACEVLVEIFIKGKESFARLKSHVRRMAFQILGPEPPLAAQTTAPSPEPSTESEPSRPLEKKKRQTRTAASVPPPAAARADSAPNGRSAIMEQYQAAKEKQPRHFVLNKFQEWLNQEGLAFVAISARILCRMVCNRISCSRR